AGVVLRGAGSHWSGHHVPELSDPADSGRGSRPLTPLQITDCRLQNEKTRAASDGSSNLQSEIGNLQSEREPLLLCQRVSKWYGPVIGVNQVTLELREGITGLVGANGAGKSTLMRLITGHLRPDLGRVTIRGFDAWSSRAKWLVGYCPEIDNFYEEMSGRAFVEAMARLSGYTRREARRRTEEALEQV